MIDSKLLLFGVGIGFIMDIIGMGLMSVGIIFGWFIGLMTMTKWEIREKKNNENKKTNKRTN